MKKLFMFLMVGVLAQTAYGADGTHTKLKADEKTKYTIWTWSGNSWKESKKNIRFTNKIFLPQDSVVLYGKAVRNKDGETVRDGLTHGCWRSYDLQNCLDEASKSINFYKEGDKIKIAVRARTASATIEKVCTKEDRDKLSVVARGKTCRIIDPKHKDQVVIGGSQHADLIAVSDFKRTYTGKDTFIVTYADKKADSENVLCGTCGGNKACQACTFE